MTCVPALGPVAMGTCKGKAFSGRGTHLQGVLWDRGAVIAAGSTRVAPKIATKVPGGVRRPFEGGPEAPANAPAQACEVRGPHSIGPGQRWSLHPGWNPRARKVNSRRQARIGTRPGRPAPRRPCRTRAGRPALCPPSRRRGRPFPSRQGPRRPAGWGRRCRGGTL